MVTFDNYFMFLSDEEKIVQMLNLDFRIKSEENFDNAVSLTVKYVNDSYWKFVRNSQSVTV